MPTDTLYIRQSVKPTDNYLKWMNDPEVTKYLEARFYTHTKETIAQYCTKQSADPNVAFFGIYVNNVHIGNIKLEINQNHKWAEIGLVIDKPYWGKGYGTKAIKLVSEYAFDLRAVHKLIAGVYSVNHASIRAFEKAGFTVEGRIKDMYQINGAWCDKIILGKGE